MFIAIPNYFFECIFKIFSYNNLACKYQLISIQFCWYYLVDNTYFEMCFYHVKNYSKFFNFQFRLINQFKSFCHCFVSVCINVLLLKGWTENQLQICLVKPSPKSKLLQFFPCEALQVSENAWFTVASKPPTTKQCC